MIKGDKMKQFYKNTCILLIFFLILLFKESIYGLIIKGTNLDTLDSRVAEIKSTYYEEEYFKLANSIDLLVNDEYNYIYSKVLYRDVYDFFKEMTILKGSEDGVAVNSAVLNESGLIGTIKKVNKNSSVVTLITNPDSQISIKVNNTYGILESKNSKLVLTSINNYEDIAIGDIVYTSGIGNLPGGIKVGTVSSVSKNALGIEQMITVTSDVDFNALDYVAVFNEGEV